MTTQEPTEIDHEREIRTSDPERIQALAHPLRLALLDVIQELGEATASECAERLGQTVANCSFHLRVLAKAGFIERAEPRGREKPWRSASTTRRLEPDPESQASYLALSELMAVTMGHITSRLTSYMRDHAQQEDPTWHEAISLNQASLWVTADEARQLQRQLQAVTEPFHGRSADPGKRPTGARLVRVVSLLHPESPQNPKE